MLYSLISCQKAPSTRRCIKTRHPSQRGRSRTRVRKPPAPEGALRHLDCVVLDVRSIVRKRPAPEGALRQRTGRVDVEGHVRQKAPGTRKCIKAGQLVWGKQTPNQVRKHPAPEGALRRKVVKGTIAPAVKSECTQHQKVH